MNQCVSCHPLMRTSQQVIMSVSPKLFPRFSICAAPDARCVHKYYNLFLHLRSSILITTDYLEMRSKDAQKMVSSACIEWLFLNENIFYLIIFYLYTHFSIKCMFSNFFFGQCTVFFPFGHPSLFSFFFAIIDLIWTVWDKQNIDV